MLLLSVSDYRELLKAMAAAAKAGNVAAFTALEVQLDAFHAQCDRMHDAARLKAKEARK